ncbi:transmembrane anchor protein [Rhizobium sp. PL01]|uniref:transmembrane anchor protein n=1 Tax=Rhizobium sp. PL01 TaxID=3085631 RepID=UPI002982B283|nr:transmembrane anchor protein [Rhizobium sp. PL01]MDW5316170.1 transmembrane anchor protein [Rhizobium sp. PL01]
MFNSQTPAPGELPSAKQLVKSTVMAAAVAVVILVTVVLPSEYGIDPTGTGSVLGLTEMGEIKTQLAEEAEADLKKTQEMQVPATIRATPQQGSSLMDRLIQEFGVRAAFAQEVRQDEMSVMLKPGEATEIKLTMTAGAKAAYEWTAEGGVVNFDMHADGNSGETISYEKGRAKPSGSGELQAAFDGKHGWFWRNRSNGDVTLTLKTSGAYSEIKKVM